MSGSKKRRRRHAFALPQMENTAIANFCVVLAVLFTVLTRCVVVRRTGVRGGGYFFAAYEFMVFLLLFFPAGVSATIREQFGQRLETGFFRNAKRIFNAAVVSLFFYILIVAILWWRFSEGVSEIVLLGKTNTLPLLLLLPVFVLDVLTLLLRGFLDGESDAADGQTIDDTHVGSVAFLVRQAATFFFVLIFAGTFQVNGINVAKLFRNEKVQYVYGAAGVAIGFLLGAIVGLITYALFYFNHLNNLQRRVDRDQNRRRENSNGILVTYAANAAAAYVGMFGMSFVAQLLSMRHFRAEAQLVRSYQWGMLEGLCKTSWCFPLLLIFLMYLGDAKLITRAIRRGDSHEVRIKCQSLMEFSMLVTFFLAGFYFGAARLITKGMFGIESVMAVRMLRFGSITMVFMAYAFITSLQLLFMQQKTRVALHTFAALLVGGLLLWILLPSNRLGIYAVFGANIVFSAVLIFWNLLILNRKIRLRPDIRRHLIWPLAFALISGAFALLLCLLFGLFMPSLLAVVIIFPLSLLVYFITGCKMGVISEYTFYGIPLGEQMERFGHRLRIL